VPWDVEKRGDKWCVVKAADSSTVACHDSESSAEAQVRALYANANTTEIEVYELSLAVAPGGRGLLKYWTRGEGAVKIRWGTDGAMGRCIRHLSKHPSITDPGGLCAEYHKAATGEWPRGGTVPSELDGETFTTQTEDTLGFTVDETGAWEGTLIVEGIESGDGREFAHNSLDWDDPASGNMPLDWQYEYSHGGTNDKTTRVGTIHEVWREGPVMLPGHPEPVMLVNGRGTLDLGGPPDDHAHEAFRRMSEKPTPRLTGVSGMVDSTKDAFVEEIYPEQPQTEGLEGDVVSLVFGKPEKTIYHKGRLRGATLVEYPAFTESRIYLRSESPPASGVGSPLESTRSPAYALGEQHFTELSDGPWNAPLHASRLPRDLKLTSALRAFATVNWHTSGMTSRDDCALLHHEVDENGVAGPANVTGVTAALRALDLMRLPAERVERARAHLQRHLEAAGMAPTPPAEPLTAAAHVITISDVPPAEWFAEPLDVQQHGALTVTDQGRVYGWLAPANVAHRSFADRRVYAPRNVDYRRFLGGETIVAGGGRVVTGPITMECGHANPHDPRRADLNWAPDHYHNTCSVVARVNVGESERGTWVAGALVAGVTAEQITKMMTCRLSGDWQPIRDQPGRRELVAALLVPVPGFPLARSAPTVQVDNGELIAASVPVRVVHADADVDFELQRSRVERNAFDVVIASLQRRLGRTPADRVAALKSRVHSTATLDVGDDASFRFRRNQKRNPATGQWIDDTVGDGVHGRGRISSVPNIGDSDVDYVDLPVEGPTRSGNRKRLRQLQEQAEDQGLDESEARELRTLEELLDDEMDEETRRRRENALEGD